MKKKICLNMIVKDEARVIRRSLASVKSLIDYWVIVDTGSTDGTQEVIKDFFKDLPGELHERPWVHFAHNRNEALQLAKSKGDYLLFIDADDELVIPKQFQFPILNLGYYLITQRDVAFNMDSLWPLLIDAHLDWNWVGVAHETLECQESASSGMLGGLVNLYHNDGKRSLDPNKKKKVIEMLEEGLVNEPENSRYMFYLAQSYRGLELYDQAILIYQKRALMGGEVEEIYSSLYWIGRLQEELKEPPETFISSFLRAHEASPPRGEPIYSIIAYYIRTKQFLLGYLLSKYALSLPPLPKGATFVLSWIYDWGLLFEFYLSAKGLGKKSEASRAAKKLLSHPDFPEEYRRGL